MTSENKMTSRACKFWPLNFEDDIKLFVPCPTHLLRQQKSRLNRDEMACGFYFPMFVTSLFIKEENMHLPISIMLNVKI